MGPDTVELVATVLFALAVAHTFSVKRFQHLANRYPEGSIGENVFHLLGEVEVVFGLWAGILVAAMMFLIGTRDAIRFVESLNFTEPMFVFVIMAMAATRPVRYMAEAVVMAAARLVPLVPSQRAYVASLVVGPLLGSFITEPAAMTVTALLMKERFFGSRSSGFLYATMAVLFVNVSIGGVLTHFAAPPVLMVAGKWGWGTGYMAAHFGWKAVIAVVLNAVLAATVFRKELQQLAGEPRRRRENGGTPAWLLFVHAVFLAAVVATAHHPVLFLALFLFFVGLVTITREYQDELKLKESLLVGFFLGGLVVLGALQQWWLKPLLVALPPLPLYVGSILLTGFVDNAALTYLVAQVEGISDALKYAAVAGAVTGGGLTVIANAPNPAGFSILQSSFGKEGVSPIALFVAALPPTLVAALCFWLLPG